MDDIDVKLLKITQDGILLVPEPFNEVAAQLGISVDDVIHRIENLQRKGVIRRFGASIGHRVIGITANAMCTGAIMAGFTEVTHCYQRPRRQGWPYNLFTMVHAYTQEECQRVARQISRATSIDDYNILFSEKEFKKTGVRL